ncbi:hypothetical protein GF402_10225 [Candidatus Fermentibacteria bacterium]|nr:hypothetical protein [Candidatus Fermentibacteria bacterium]
MKSLLTLGLLLCLVGSSAAATITIVNDTDYDAAVRFYSHSDQEWWGPFPVLAHTSKDFTVPEGYYDIEVTKENGDHYTLIDIWASDDIDGFCHYVQ